MSHLWISVEANSTFVFLSSPLLSFLMTGNHSYWGNLRHCHLTFLYLYWLCNSPYPRIPIEANTITWLKFVWRWQLPRIATGNDTLFLPRFASAWICIWISFASYCSAMTTKPFAASIWFRYKRFFMTCVEIQRPFQYVSWSTNDQWMMNNTDSRNDERWIDFDVRGNNILRDELTKIFDQNDREKQFQKRWETLMFDLWRQKLCSQGRKSTSRRWHQIGNNFW